MAQSLIATESLEKCRQAIQDAHFAGEDATVQSYIDYIALTPSQRSKITQSATKMILQARQDFKKSPGIEGVLQNYTLDSQEGQSLMCMAEALLRIPDAFTRDKLIRDKIKNPDWKQKKHETTLASLSSFALSMTKNLLKGKNDDKNSGFFRNLLATTSAPIIRESTNQSMKVLGKHFVLGETVKKALKRAQSEEKKGYTYSYDMLGEAAVTQEDADRYFKEYAQAIDAIAQTASGETVMDRPGISVKLSALHPKYEYTNKKRVILELVPKVKDLAHRACRANIGFNIDAEEARRFDLSLDVIKKVFLDPAFKNWNGFGVALQSYQKRAFATIDWLAALSQQGGRPIMVRLVKGAYWDSEIKHAQVESHEDYPVFTRKTSTDISYLACAQKLLSMPGNIYPQFATHNAFTIAAIQEMAGKNAYEFQRLHGMGNFLYDPIIHGQNNIRCRIYAPVGGHRDLLSYLVRRLLENGANSSFVNHLFDKEVPAENLAIDPLVKINQYTSIRNHQIPKPRDIYLPKRTNSNGIDLGDAEDVKALTEVLKHIQNDAIAEAGSLIGGKICLGETKRTFAPFDKSIPVGSIHQATKEDVDNAFDLATEGFEAWSSYGAEERAQVLEKTALLLEERKHHFYKICQLEAGKNIPDAIAEVREAIDFCRYYAERIRIDFASPTVMPGPTGESNQLSLHPRGIFACISPWNFPLAIFTGQVMGALSAGNAVIAKPASQTPVIAFEAVKLMHEAGIPQKALQLLIGPGSTVGERLISHPKVAGIAFTGSTQTARHINTTLAAKEGPIVPFIAETGGMNCMVVDSSALSEQVAQDVIRSAFQSAGQRCSALRILFLQEDIADDFMDKIKGAMNELTIGSPVNLDTDIGPVIDANARKDLLAHIDFLKENSKSLYKMDLTKVHDRGYFVPPTLCEIDSPTLLKEEVFGPILHVVRFKAKDLKKVINDINATGYGLTLGVHSRIDETIDAVVSHARVGNLYVNRNTIGAVVGTQPFGGEGLSGTGPKAGGPHYLHRFAVERTVSVNTTASGGNATLLALDD